MLVHFIILILLFYTEMDYSVFVGSKHVNVHLTRYFMYLFYRRWLHFFENYNIFSMADRR